MNETFQNYLTRYLMPIAIYVEKQKHLQAIKDGMVAIVPIIIIGSFCLLPIGIANLLGSGSVHDFIIKHLDKFTYPTKFTTGLISVYAVYFIATALSERYQLQGKQLGIIAIITHAIISGAVTEKGIDTAFLGAEGLFTSILSAIMVVEVTRILFKYNIVIRLPDSVPSMVADSFTALIPMFINVVIGTWLVFISQHFSGNAPPAFIMDLLAPAISTMDTLPALLLVMFFTQLLWFFGIHGAAVTSAVWASFAITYAAENVAAYSEGLPVTHIFTYGLYFNMLSPTGSGLTLGLVLMMMRSKAKGLSSMGKASFVPSLFGINEPVIFGTPIILNPFLFIPFVFGPLIITTTTYFALKSSLVGLPIANPPGFLPPGVGAFIMTLDWKAPVLVFSSLIIMALIYYPFFKIMEKEELAKEAQMEETI